MKIIIPDYKLSIDADDSGLTFDGVGALSGAGVARLLVDYPEGVKSDIVKLLFAPQFGAALQDLKVEIGSDQNSSVGAEACHCRTQSEYDDMMTHIDDPDYAPNVERFNRGYEWELMKRARAENPDLHLNLMPFAVPEWCTGNGEHNVANEKWIDYFISFLQGALIYHNLSFEYITLRNEISSVTREWPSPVVASYKRRLDDFNRKYGQHVKLVGIDSGGGAALGNRSFDFVKELESDSNYFESLYAYAEHYAGWTVDSRIREIPLRKHNPIRLWDTEDQASYNIPAVDNSSLNAEGKLETEWDRALHYARIINRNYPNANITKTLIVNLLGSYYNRNYSGCWILTANQPWSGWYDMNPGIWTIAHTTQAAKIGWRYLDNGCKVIKEGDHIVGSIVTMMDPNNQKDYSIIIELADATSPKTVHFDKPVGVSAAPLQLWVTSRTDLFLRVGHLNTNDDDGFDIAIQPGMIYTLTTRTDLNHVGTDPAVIAPTGPFPLPYADDFDRSVNGKLPKYFTDMCGAFEVVDGGTSGIGKCVKQVVIEKSNNQYLGVADNYFPVTYIGNQHWTDYEVSASIKLGHETPEGWAGIIGRAISRDYTTPDSYMLILKKTADSKANWQLVKEKSGRSGNETHEILFSTQIFGLDWNKWHRLKLRFEGNLITAWLNGEKVVVDYPCNQETGSPYTCGMCGFASGYHYAYFDDFQINMLENSPPAPESFVKRVNLNHYEAVNSFKTLGIPGTKVKLGTRIYVKQGITVTALGRYRINRNKGPHTVSVYDADTFELKGEAAVWMSDPHNPGNVNYSAIEMDYFHGFVYAPLRMHLKLGSYLIVSDETVGEDKWYGGESYLPILEPGDPKKIEIVSGVKCSGDPNLSSSWTNSTSEGKSGNCYGPVNFRYLIDTL